MASEYIILDSVVVCLSIHVDATQSGKADYRHLTGLSGALRLICQPPRDKLILLDGRAHHPIYASSDGLASGCSWTGTGEGDGSGQIVIAPEGQDDARIRVGVKLARSKDGNKEWLTVEFNPTTILIAHNIHPAALLNPATGEEVFSPSSHWGAMSRMFRFGFEFLEAMVEGELFDSATKLAIERGDFHLVRAQWAATKRVQNVDRFLQLLTVVYDPTIARGRGIMSNATHLGLEFEPFIDRDSCLVTGGLFQKRHGTKLLFSVSPYNKQARLEQTHQNIDQLDKALAVTVKESVREDITAHSEGIVIIAKKAQRRLEAWREKGLEFFDFISPEVFLREEPKPTLWWLQRAIFILSHYRQRGKFKRFSFGVWLVPYIETDVLHFDVIAGITAEGFHQMLRLTDPVAEAWRNDKVVSRDGWAERLAKAANCSPATVYNRRDLWRSKIGIDIAFPLQLYADVLHFGQSATASPENIIKMLVAAKIEDGEAVVRHYNEALANFEQDRLTILNPALVSRPRAMRLEGPAGGSPQLIDFDGDAGEMEADDLDLDDLKQDDLGLDRVELEDIDQDAEIIESDDLEDLSLPPSVAKETTEARPRGARVPTVVKPLRPSAAEVREAKRANKPTRAGASPVKPPRAPATPSK